MHAHANPSRLLSLAASLLACLCGLSAAANAQTATVTYTLEDVWLLPDISHPREDPQQMTGTFEWTYNVGDFENGTGQFLEMYMPWYGSDFAALDITFDLGSIEFVLPGDYHDLGVDVTLSLAPPLSPDQAAIIDTVRSKFDIERGISHKGHVISGSIVPECSLPQNYGSGGAGSGGFVPTITSSGGHPHIGNDQFAVECDQLLGGATCFFIIGFAQDQFGFKGIDLLVSPLRWFVIPLQANGTPGVPGAGGLHIPAPIPNEPLAIGVEVDFQVLTLDPGAPRGLAATDGLTMRICSSQ